MLREFLEVLRISWDFLKEFWQLILAIPAVLAAVGAVLIFRNQIWPSFRLIRHCLSSKKVTPWWQAVYELFFCATKLLANHSLFRVVRLRVELEILMPPPVRDNNNDPVFKKKNGSAYTAKRKQWNRKIHDELRSLAYSSAHERPTIRLPNTFAFYQAEEEIRNYLRFLFHLTGAPLGKAERGRFFCQVNIPDGHLMPLHLVTGLLAHFGKDWKPILDQYEHSQGDSRPMLNRFMMDTWLLWGPSIPLCTCSRWQGGIALQFGYGDENNSLPVFIPYSERKSVLRKMEAQQMALIRPLENPHCQALGSRVVFTGVPIWCESLDGRELASAQSSLRDPEKSGLLLEYVTHEEKASPGSQDSAGYYSAYIWLMLEVTRSSRWSGGPPSPDQPWLRLIPIYEHANLFDHAAFTFFKKRLAEKAVQFLEHERNSDLEFQCRLACAIDDTGCASEPIHAFPGPSISYYMQEILDRKEHAELRTRIDLRRPSGGSTMSACHIPGWVGQLEKHVSPEEAFPHAGSEFEPHEFGDGRADRRLLSRLYRDLYEKEFPDPDERESLENILDYLGKKRSGWYERNNYHVLALLKEGNPVAVSICDYFAEPNAGVIEFLAIHPGWRKQGLGAKILKMTEQVLEQDALRAGNELSVILAEMEDPYKTDPPDADPPGTGMDASARAKIWGKWGFFRLNFPYVQPSLGKGKQAVTHLLLLAKRMKGEDPAASGALWESEKSMQAAGLRIALKAYMRWAMRIDKPEEEDAYKFMSNQLSRSPDVPLVSLDDYLEKAHGRMKLRECLAAGDGAFNASMRIYEEAFAGKAQTAIPRQEFTKQLEKQGKRKERQERDKERDDKPGSCAYHLCAVSDPAKPDAGSIGMVSFFTFPGFGFGGYLALSRDQRHQGRLAGLICAVEDSMLRDRMGAKGWFIECDPEDGAAPWFEKRGFHQVPFTYRQPPLPGSKEGDGRPLLLLYKEFGPDLDGPPPLLRAEAVRGFLVHLGNEVYGLEKTEATSWSQALHDECHLKWKDTASPSWAVPFKPRQGQ